MTRNQIEYWDLLEKRRSNQMNEALTQRRDEANITQKKRELSETKRHNKVVEGQAYADLGIKQYSAESGRITAQANMWNAESNSRNASSNERNASTNAYNAQVNAMNAQTNARNAQTNALAQQEARRHNVISEATERMRAQSGATSARANVTQAVAAASQAATASGKLDLDTEKWLLQSGYTQKEIELLEKEIRYYGPEHTADIVEAWTKSLNNLTQAGRTATGTMKDWLR